MHGIHKPGQPKNDAKANCCIRHIIFISIRCSGGTLTKLNGIMLLNTVASTSFVSINSRLSRKNKMGKCLLRINTPDVCLGSEESSAQICIDMSRATVGDNSFQLCRGQQILKKTGWIFKKKTTLRRKKWGRKDQVNISTMKERPHWKALEEGLANQTT